MRRGLVAIVLVCLPVLAEPVLLERVDLPWDLDPWSKAPGAAAVVDGRLQVTCDWPEGKEFRFFSVTPRLRRGAVPFRISAVSVQLEVLEPLDRTIELHFADADGKDQKVFLADGKQAGPREARVAIPADWKQPLRMTSLTWHNWGRDDAGGRLTVAYAELTAELDLTAPLVQDPPPTFWAWADGEYGLADAGGRVALQSWLEPWPGDTRKYATRWELHDGDGARLAGGEAAPATLELPRCGVYEAAVTATAEGREPLTRTVGLARLPEPAAVGPARSAIGINTHLDAPWRLFAALGIHWARDYSWGWLGRGETAPIGNGLDFQRVWQRAREAGVIVLPVCMGSFRNADQTAFDSPEAIRPGFERLSRALPEVTHWEIDNEFDYHLASKHFDAGNYAAALRAAAEGLAAAGNGAKLVLNGTAGIFHDDTMALLHSPAAGAFEVVNSHHYTGIAPPELATTDAVVEGRRRTMTFLDLLKLVTVKAHAAGKEHWLTEVGWDATGGPAVGEELQALYLPRIYLLARAVGVDKVFWYFDRDTEGDGIFSSCGLRRRDGSLRPAAVALAAMSSQTAAGKVLGTLDLGDPDIWAVALEQPAGDFTIAAWSALAEHPLPVELRGAPATDGFGNPAQPATLGPLVHYVRVPRLTEAWRRQLDCHWNSPTVVALHPTGRTALDVELPGAPLRWTGLPAGVQADGLALSADADAPEGVYAVTATAGGDGWQRSWPIQLRIERLIDIVAPPYEPGQADLLTLTSREDTHEVTARLRGGVVAPERFTVAGLPQRIAVAPDRDATGVLELELQLANGVRQLVPLRPLRLEVPRVDGLSADAKLDDWPAAATWPDGMVVATRRELAPRVRLGWSPDGLAVAAELTVPGLLGGRLQSFWDWTCLELFAKPDGGAMRQVVLMPEQRDGRWQLAVALWDRAAGRAVRLDDVPAAMMLDGHALTIEALIPTSALGGTPEPGGAWRLGLSVHGVAIDATWDAAWPRLKADGLLGAAGLGSARFAAP